MCFKRNREKNIFISHSNNDKKIVSHLVSLIKNYSFLEKDIFCSSRDGQGVNNSEEIRKKIFHELKKANLYIFCISEDFLHSPYCIQELGIGSFLSDDKNKKAFYLLFPGIEMKDIVGFMNTKIDKVSMIHIESDLGKIIDDLLIHFNVGAKPISENNNNIRNFYDACKEAFNGMIENKQKCDEKKNNDLKELHVLKQIIADQGEKIVSQNNQIKTSKVEQQKELLMEELNILSNWFSGLGFKVKNPEIIRQFKERDFFLSVIKRLLELKSLLKLKSLNTYINFFISSIYLAYGLQDDSYFYINENAKILDYITVSQIEEFANNNDKSMKATIDLLLEKSDKMEISIGKDLIENCIEYLNKREEKFLNKI